MDIEELMDMKITRAVVEQAGRQAVCVESDMRFRYQSRYRDGTWGIYCIQVLLLGFAVCWSLFLSSVLY